MNKAWILLLLLVSPLSISYASFGGGGFGDGGSGSGGSGSGTVNSGTTNQVAKYSSSGTAVSGSSVLFDTGSNVGVGSSAPGVNLDVQGSIRASSAIIYPDGTSYQGSLPGTSQAWIDCVATPNADGSICSNQALTTTTGSISSASKSLTVGSLSGWSVGMGIAVAQAGNSGGTTELITYITSCGATSAGSPCTSTTFTLNSASANSGSLSGVTVTHDETRAGNDALQTGLNLYLRGGGTGYNVTGTGWTQKTLTQTPAQNSQIIQCDGNIDQLIQSSPVPTTAGGTTIWHRSTTGDVIHLSAGYTNLRNCTILQASGITPTAGAAVSISADGSGFHTRDIVVRDLYFSGTFNGIVLTDTVNFAQFYQIRGKAKNIGFNVNLSASYGFSAANVAINPVTGSSGTGIYIQTADESSMVNVQSEGWATDLKIDDSGSGSVVQNMRFTNLSIEDASTVGIIISSTGTGSVHHINFDQVECNQPSSVNCMTVNSKANNITVSNLVQYGAGGGIVFSGVGGNMAANNINCGNGAAFCAATSSGSPATNVQFTNIVCDSTVVNCTQNGNNSGGNLFQSCKGGACNVGIGTLATTAYLDVNGTVGAFGALIRSGNVGIGSPNPGSVLDVQGSIRGSGSFVSGTSVGISGTGTTSCLCKAYTGGICTSLGTCT